MERKLKLSRKQKKWETKIKTFIDAIQPNNINNFVNNNNFLEGKEHYMDIFRNTQIFDVSACGYFIYKSTMLGRKLLPCPRGKNFFTWDSMVLTGNIFLCHLCYPFGDLLVKCHPRFTWDESFQKVSPHFETL